MKKYQETPEQMKKVIEIVKKNGGIYCIAKTLNIGGFIARRLRNQALKQLGKAYSNVDNHPKNSKQYIENEINEKYQDLVKTVSQIRRAKRKWEMEWKTPLKGPIGIAFMADMHVGGADVDYEVFERDLDLICNTDGMYVVLGGDLIDNHIKHLAAIITASMPPKQQYEWLEKILNRLNDANKLIAIVSGNHEYFTVAVTGWSVLQNMAKKSLIPYEDNEAAITVKHGKVSYLISVRHKYRFNSSFNPGHSVRRLWEMGDYDFDCGVICHNHMAACEIGVKHGRERWFLRPGTYQLISKYAQREGFHGALPITPAIILRDDRKDMIGIAKLDWACEILKKLRKK